MVWPGVIRASALGRLRIGSASVPGFASLPSVAIHRSPAGAVPPVPAELVPAAPPPPVAPPAGAPALLVALPAPETFPLPAPLVGPEPPLGPVELVPAADVPPRLAPEPPWVISVPPPVPVLLPHATAKAAPAQSAFLSIASSANV